MKQYTQPILRDAAQERGFSSDERYRAHAGMRVVCAAGATVDSFGVAPHHRQMITIPCAALSKKIPLPGMLDRRAR